MESKTSKSPESVVRKIKRKTRCKFNYNNNRYHEALNNLTPAAVYYGKGRKILTRRERIKKNTTIQRRRYNCSLKVA